MFLPPKNDDNEGIDVSKNGYVNGSEPFSILWLSFTGLNKQI